MIIQQTPDGPVAVKQVDHAAFAAFLLEHWSDHTFASDPEREQILFATREHDNGWIPLDNKPELDEESGLPPQFDEVGPDLATKIWRRGVETYRDVRPFVALLITHHAYSIMEIAHKRDPVWKEFFTEFAQLRAELRTQLDRTHPQVERAYSYLRMADWFSLSWCREHELGVEKPEQYGGYQYKREGNQFLFKPYPFDQRDLTYELPVYPLEESYDHVRSLRAAFKEPVIQEIVLNPLGRLRR